MGFWGRNIAGRGKGRSSGEEREGLAQGSEGRKGGSNVTEVSATRLCVRNRGLGWEHSIFSECYQKALDHFLAKKSHNLTCVLYESLKNLFNL